MDKLTKWRYDRLDREDDALLREYEESANLENDNVPTTMEIQRKISALHRAKEFRNTIQRLDLTDRVELIDNGSGIFDNKFYYYSNLKMARVEGSKKWYSVRNFAKFLEVFLGIKE